MEMVLIKITMEKRVAVVSINNHPVNAITPQFIDELEETFQYLAQVQDLRCVIIASGIEKVFAAGADINQFVSWKAIDGIETCRRGHDVFSQIAGFPKPVICAINGIAFGGGMELALACDIRVIEEKAKVGLPECGLGIIPGYGGTIRLSKLVGPGMAKKMILSAEPISGIEAYRIGLAEILTGAGESLAEAKKMAETISMRAPMAVASGKDSINYGMEHSICEAIDFEIEQVGKLCETQDKTEGAKAFLEKRLAEFKNK